MNGRDRNLKSGSRLWRSDDVSNGKGPDSSSGFTTTTTSVAAAAAATTTTTTVAAAAAASTTTAAAAAAAGSGAVITCNSFPFFLHCLLPLCSPA